MIEKEAGLRDATIKVQSAGVSSDTLIRFGWAFSLCVRQGVALTPDRIESIISGALGERGGKVG